MFNESITLLNFGSFFALFAALNLAYAGSKSFRMALNRDILKLDDIIKKLYKEVSEIEQRYNIDYKDENETNKKIKERFAELRDAYFQKVEIDFNDFKESRKVYSSFKKDYRRLFLCSALFCILVLVFIGFEKYSPVQFTIVLFYSHIVAFFTFPYIFAAGFIRNGKPLLEPLTVVQTIMITVLVYLFSCVRMSDTEHCYFLMNTINFKIHTGIWISIVIAIAPYLLYFFKALLYRLENRQLSQKHKTSLYASRKKFDQDMESTLLDEAFTE